MTSVSESLTWSVRLARTLGPACRLAARLEVAAARAVSALARRPAGLEELATEGGMFGLVGRVGGPGGWLGQHSGQLPPSLLQSGQYRCFRGHHHFSAYV